MVCSAPWSWPISDLCTVRNMDPLISGGFLRCFLVLWWSSGGQGGRGLPQGVTSGGHFQLRGSSAPKLARILDQGAPRFLGGPEVNFQNKWIDKIEISPCLLSSEDKKHGEIGFKCLSVNNCSDPVQTWIFTRQKAWQNWFQVFSLWMIVQIQYKPEYSWDRKYDEIGLIVFSLNNCSHPVQTWIFLNRKHDEIGFKCFLCE